MSRPRASSPWPQWVPDPAGEIGLRVARGEPLTIPQEIAVYRGVLQVLHPAEEMLYVTGGAQGDRLRRAVTALIDEIRGIPGVCST